MNKNKQKKSWCPVMPPRFCHRICSGWHACSPNPTQDITMLFDCQITTRPLIRKVDATPYDSR